MYVRWKNKQQEKPKRHYTLQELRWELQDALFGLNLDFINATDSILNYKSET